MGIRIVTDSACDLSQEMIDEYRIAVVPLYINIGDQSYLDGVDLTRRSFYESLPHYDVHPTTATPSQETFLSQYRRLAEEGATEIISIHVAESLSATVNVARSAANEINRIPVHVYDSRQLSFGAGFLVYAAAKAAEEGRRRAEIQRILDDQVRRTYVWAALDTLEFLRRSGRLNRVVHTLGSLLQVKPLLKMYDGVADSENVRTRQQAHLRLRALLDEQAPFERVAVVHTNAPSEAEKLRKQVSHLLPEGVHPSVNVTPVIGAHIGPGAVGFAVVKAPG